MLYLSLLWSYLINISFFTTGLYILALIYLAFTRSISSDSIWTVTGSLLVLHLFWHDYSGSTIRALKNPNLTRCISLNASIAVSFFVTSHLPSRLHIFASIHFSLQFVLFAPLVTYCIKKFSFRLHLLFSFSLMCLTLSSIYVLHKLLFFSFFSWFLSMLYALIGLFECKSKSLRSMVLGMNPSLVLKLPIDLILFWICNRHLTLDDVVTKKMMGK